MTFIVIELIFCKEDEEETMQQNIMSDTKKKASKYNYAIVAPPQQSHTPATDQFLRRNNLWDRG